MKRVSGKNSLALLCILAGIVYLLILVPTVIEGVEGGIQGRKRDLNHLRKQLMKIFTTTSIQSHTF
jgi:hypothetical protein